MFLHVKFGVKFIQKLAIILPHHIWNISGMSLSISTTLSGKVRHSNSTPLSLGPSRWIVAAFTHPLTTFPQTQLKSNEDGPPLCRTTLSIWNPLLNSLTKFTFDFVSVNFSLIMFVVFWSSPNSLPILLYIRFAE